MDPALEAAQSALRQRIRAVNQDASLSSREKAQQIQAIVSGRPISASSDGTAANSPAAAARNAVRVLSESDLDRRISRQNGNFYDAAQEEDRGRASADVVPESAVSAAGADALYDLSPLGCVHYKRNCRMKAPCCGQLFTCRICHDEADFGSAGPPELRCVSEHKINRHAVEEMLCMLCDTLQPKAQVCGSCGLCMARYFCRICSFWDDSGRSLFHCEDCGICRVGKREDYTHCKKCNMCLPPEVFASHKCLEEAFQRPCPLCHEDIHSSRNAAHILPCSHTMCGACFKECPRKNVYRCPLCNRSMYPMTRVWREMKVSIEQETMPPEFAEATADIHCHDCQQKSSGVRFHFIGHECSSCGSFNTALEGTHNMPRFDPLGRIQAHIDQRRQRQREQGQQETEGPEVASDEDDLYDDSDDSDERSR